MDIPKLLDPLYDVPTSVRRQFRWNEKVGHGCVAVEVNVLNCSNKDAAEQADRRQQELVAAVRAMPQSLQCRERIACRVFPGDTLAARALHGHTNRGSVHTRDSLIHYLLKPVLDDPDGHGVLLTRVSMASIWLVRAGTVTLLDFLTIGTGSARHRATRALAMTFDFLQTLSGVSLDALHVDEESVSVPGELCMTIPELTEGVLA